jgi:hypothetical protein
MADKPQNLEQLLADAKARMAAMTPEELEHMREEQRKSFVRGMLARCEHGELDFEQCPKCRGWDK